uniref:NAD-dependent epimerase/dehydratase domain-containing protein n=1 Tax=Palpitomonas bilix TaxID=652834 RepID=A0A7S3GJY7_9EUKA|mmetsp:Transcript_6773/g.17023  ORF Transcript_6773/g.17023 Transcript_6773/m.17023 type:complete len:196 (+) Transcript_6773:59-646(+)
MSAGKVAKVLVTGGNGFVGSAVCRAALSKGLHVISVNRSGRPNLKGDWVDKVVWVKADTLEKEQWSSHLEGVKGVVACVGGFGSNEVMKKICGSTNVAAAEAAKQGGASICLLALCIEPTFLSPSAHPALFTLFTLSHPPEFLFYFVAFFAHVFVLRSPCMVKVSSALPSSLPTTTSCPSSSLDTTKGNKWPKRL